MRFSKVDTVIYFRFNRILCLWRIVKRLIHKHPHISDRAEGCTENIRFRLIKYLWGFPQRVSQSIEDLRLKYPEAKFYEFQNDGQAHSFLNTLKKSKKYTYKPYSNTFPSLFQKEKKRISSSLDIALAIEHVGSTSIPGLGGKGIIDIAISVSKEKMEHASQILHELGYEYRPTFSTPERFYFIIYLADSEEGNRRYHIHLTYPSSKEWKELIGFRDYLRAHPEAVEEYAAIKKHAANTANQDGEHYRKMKEPLFQKINAFIKEFHFTHAKASQRALLHQWFEQKHIKEWMHGVGLQNTLNGLEKFFLGESTTTYWVGYDKDTPFAFLITSPEGKDATTLDLFICDLNYLRKGIAVPMIKEFLRSQFPHVKRVLIDPEATNARAIHVYQKVGFKIVGEFIASWHPVSHYQMELLMKDLLPSIGASNA